MRRVISEKGRLVVSTNGGRKEPMCRPINGAQCTWAEVAGLRGQNQVGRTIHPLGPWATGKEFVKRKVVFLTDIGRSPPAAGWRAG